MSWFFYYFVTSLLTFAATERFGERSLYVCVTDPNNNLPHGILLLQRLKRAHYICESKLLRDDGLDVVCGDEGAEFGEEVAREAGLAAD
jgi:hypothetical protein